MMGLKAWNLFTLAVSKKKRKKEKEKKIYYFMKNQPFKELNGIILHKIINLPKCKNT